MPIRHCSHWLPVAVLFLLLSEITGDAKLSALGAFLFFLSALSQATTGKMIHLLDGGWYAGFPFLRRYQPGIGFPLFFVFVLLIWRTATRTRSLGSGHFNCFRCLLCVACVQ